MAGLTLGNADTPLTQRAADYLATGPADPQTLISYVCQLPGAPMSVAEHMAAALFAGHQKFVRSGDGRWMLREHFVIPSERSESRDPYPGGEAVVSSAQRG